MNQPAYPESSPKMAVGLDIVEETVDILTDSKAITDLWLASDDPPMARTPEGWRIIDSMPAPTFSELSEAVEKLDPDWKKNIEVGSISRAREVKNWRIRITAYLAETGSKLILTIRRQPLVPPSLKDAGLPASVQVILDNPRGLILVTGATRAGKSTTIAAMVQTLNDSRYCHVVTIEDPIEYRYSMHKAIFSLREVGPGMDCTSFAGGVRDAMRQSPDVIVIGEIRDRDTAEAAMLAAESGHLVVASLHANTAPGAIQKLLAWFPEDERQARTQTLAGSLLGVINQILLPLRDRTGYALATEIIANQNGRYNKSLGNTEKLVTLLEKHNDEDDKMSRTMGESLVMLVVNRAVAKSDALRQAKGNQIAYDQVKAIAEPA